MAGVLARKRFYFGGTLTANDAAGMPIEHHAGDPADEFVAQISKGELAIHVREGRLREVGAKPASHPAPEPPRTLTPLEIFQAAMWPRATEDDGHIRGVPGADISVMNKTPAAPDLKRATASRETVVLAHPGPDGSWVATVDLARLARLLAGRTLR